VSTLDLGPQLDQLDAQQKNLTDMLRAMLEGQWQGAPPSLEALLYAQNPTYVGQVTPRTPLLAGDAPPDAEGWYAHYDASTVMPPQPNEWCCSACALDWVLRATGAAPEHTVEEAIAEIGYPEHINPTYGLMDGSGAQLRRVLAEEGLSSSQGWLSFDTVYSLAGSTTGCMSGAAWYHWVGFRGQSGPDLWIANSAEGYQGVYSILSRADFNRLGPFSVVYLEH
jgi:hypothetical protein